MVFRALCRVYVVVSLCRTSKWNSSRPVCLLGGFSCAWQFVCAASCLWKITPVFARFVLIGCTSFVCMLQNSPYVGARVHLQHARTRLHERSCNENTFKICCASIRCHPRMIRHTFVILSTSSVRWACEERLLWRMNSYYQAKQWKFVFSLLFVASRGLFL